jgi:hypothetical protein
VSPKRATTALLTALLSLGLSGPVAHAGAPGRADPLGGGHAWLLHYKRTHGYLPIGDDFAAYERNVTLRYRRWLRSHPAAAVAPRQPATGAPTALVNVQGQKDDRLAPGDPTGAAGPRSYIQFINDKMAIYTRSGSLVQALGTGAFARPGGADTDYSDPQILWDAATRRFYYLIIHTTDDTFAWGFSKSSDPRNVATGFCHYTADFGYGSNLPDYPKLGDSRDFLLVGANIYAVEAYVGSDIDWIAKPRGRTAIRTCPDATTFKQGKQTAIKNADGQTFASDPNPAQQADPSTTGWVVAVPDETNSGAAGNFLTIFKVTRNPDGTANIPNVGTQVSVNSFAPPPPGPQQGTNFTIDTLDGRLTHAVSAVDPAHGNAVALWTGHTVSGGAGSQWQWYEVDVNGATVIQQGDVADASLFVLNGAVSPDRLVTVKNGQDVAKFGGNAVFGFTTTSASAVPAVQMASKDADSGLSAFVLVKQSPGVDNGFDCTVNPIVPDRCRWGDYSGAAPDPAAPASGPEGRVWLTNMFSTGGATPDPLNPTWSTQIWAAQP